MAQFDTAVNKLNSTDFLGYTGNPPVDEADYDARKGDMFSKDAPTWSEIQAEITAQDDAVTQKATDKASAKAKLKSGDALTDAEISALFGD